MSAIDSADRRLELAQAVLRLRDQGQIKRKFAAIAVLELDPRRLNGLPFLGSGVTRHSHGRSTHASRSCS